MRILSFADIHIGNIKDTLYVYEVMTDIIDKEVVFKHTDVVVLLGDYFHRLFKVNEEYVSLAINIMSYLIRACSRENTKIRIVYGTESHEMNQYKLFNYHITSSDIDLKIFDTVSTETIDGYKILYIPEEYIDNKSKHYGKFLSKDNHYDYIFGHGIIEDGMPSIVSYSSENTKNNEKQVPRFKSGELSAVSDICLFGHYHCFTDMHNNVYYLGSLFRDSFGEEIPKGYGIIEDHQFTFVENDRAYIYKTYEYGPTSEIYNNPDDIMNEIDRIRNENTDLFTGKCNGKIRLVFKTPESLDPTFRENLKTILFNDDRIVSLIKEPSELATELKESMEDDIDDGYAFVIDPSLNIADKLYQYICMQYEAAPMTLEELHTYIDPSIARFMDRQHEKIDDET